MSADSGAAAVDSNAVDEVLSTEPHVVVERDGVTYTLLGTAHVSRTSAEAVHTLLGTGRYDAVAVELCEARANSLANPDSWQSMDLFQVIKRGQAGMVAASLALSAYQRRLAEQFGIEPGAEMKAAIDVAVRDHLAVLLIDREVGLTLRRAYASVNWWQRWMLASGMMASLISRDEITEEEIEQLKQGDVLESTFTEFASQSEKLYGALIEERDRFMAANLRRDGVEHANGQVLAVVGAGHLKGLAQHLEHDETDPQQTIDELRTAPPRSNLWRFFPWLIALAVVGSFVYGFTSRGADIGWALIANWVLINGTLAALGVVIARGHPLTVLGTFFAAPLTSLNPMVGAGMVAALIEAVLRKPRVKDFSALRDAVTHWKGWWGNRVSRTLLVFFLAQLGSAAGTWVAGFKIVDILAS